MYDYWTKITIKVEQKYFAKRTDKMEQREKIDKNL